MKKLGAKPVGFWQDFPGELLLRVGLLAIAIWLRVFYALSRQADLRLLGALVTALWTLVTSKDVDFALSEFSFGPTPGEFGGGGASRGF